MGMRCGEVVPPRHNLSPGFFRSRRRLLHEAAWPAGMTTCATARGVWKCMPELAIVHAREVVIRLGLDTLAQHHRDPRVHGHELAIVLVDVAALPEQLHALAQRIRYFHVLAMPPERGVFSLRVLVVHADKITDAFEFGAREFVVAVDHRLLHAGEREEMRQAHRGRHDGVDAGGLQRLDKPAARPNPPSAFPGLRRRPAW